MKTYAAFFAIAIGIFVSAFAVGTALTVITPAAVAEKKDDAKKDKKNKACKCCADCACKSCK